MSNIENERLESICLINGIVFTSEYLFQDVVKLKFEIPYLRRKTKIHSNIKSMRLIDEFDP